MSLLKQQTPIFNSKESVATLVLVSVEAILLSILEGLVVWNHLALVSNCNMDSKGQGIDNIHVFSLFTDFFTQVSVNLI